MSKKSVVLIPCVLVLACVWIPTNAFGQNPPSPPCSTCVSGGGTAGTLPVFAAGSTPTRGMVQNSTIFQDASGTTVLGPVVNGNPTGQISGLDATFKGDNAGVLGWDTKIDPIPRAGVIGFIDNTSGTGVFGRANSTTGDASGVTGRSFSPGGSGVSGVGGPDPTADNPNPTGGAIGVFGSTTTIGGEGVLGVSSNTIGGSEGVSGLVNSPDATAGVFRNRAGGDLIVGEGVNDVHQFRVDGSGNVLARSYITGGADFAESVSVVGARTKYGPGDLLVIDPTRERRLGFADHAYSTLVAGIYSTKPGVLASQYKMNDPNLAKQIPLAIVGIVPCKVTAKNGSIKVGDLLVASSQPGYAMKGTDRKRMLGAVVGKALEPLSSGNGVIQVLVTLQ